MANPSLVQPPAEYKVYCLESEDLSLRGSMFFEAGISVDWGPTTRMVFGVDTRGLSFKVDSSWLDGDPELGGKETAWPDGYTSTISVLVNGQPAGQSIQLTRETPSGMLYNLLYIDLNSIKLNTIIIKQETAPGKWSWPGS